MSCGFAPLTTSWAALPVAASFASPSCAVPRCSPCARPVIPTCSPCARPVIPTCSAPRFVAPLVIPRPIVATCARPCAPRCGNPCARFF